MSVGSGFSLTLMVNHACNLRCTYCYTGTKFHSPMPAEVGNAAIDRALNSLPSGGWLDLGFFGGEPLLDAPRILDWMKYARDAAAVSRHRLGLRSRFGTRVSVSFHFALSLVPAFGPFARSTFGRQISTTHSLSRLPGTMLARGAATGTSFSTRICSIAVCSNSFVSLRCSMFASSANTTIVGTFRPLIRSTRQLKICSAR